MRRPNVRDSAADARSVKFFLLETNDRLNALLNHTLFDGAGALDTQIIEELRTTRQRIDAMIGAGRPELVAAFQFGCGPCAGLRYRQGWPLHEVSRW